MRNRFLTVSVVLVATLGLGACSSADTAAESPTSAPAASAPAASAPAAEASASGETDSLFCNGLVRLNGQADDLVESVGQTSTVRATAATTRDIARLAGTVETVGELGGANGTRLQVAGKKFEVALRRIDLTSGRDARTAAATSAAESFQSDLSSIANSANCGTVTTDQLS